MPSVALSVRLRRLLRRLNPRRRPPPVAFFHSPLYSFRIPGGLHDPDRGERILAYLAEQELLGHRQVAAPAPIGWRELRAVHSDAYLESLHLRGGLLRAFGVRLSDPQEERLLEAQRAMVAGTVAAAEFALARRGLGINLGGGLHHALAERAQGFCLFNDVAVAIHRLRASGFGGRILVLDLDLHDGDGTRALFAADPTVHTFSIHNAHWGATEAVASTAIELGGGVDDVRLLHALERHLPPVLAEFQPEFAFYLAGCDPAADDRLGNWRLSPAGLLERDRRVFAALWADLQRPLVYLLAGGYGEQTWRYSARFLAELLSGGENLEPPSTEELTLERYRRLAATLRPGELQGLEDEGWSLSEDDLYGTLGAMPQETRFLGYYSRQGIELALERYGFLAKLRQLGFERPALSFDLNHPGGHTARLFGDPGRKQLLVEMRLRRDRRTVPGFELLAIEWLLLQNPRARFTRERPALPGQKLPGLGLQRDTIALLVMVCERLRLDGLVFVPSHYHLAAQSRQRLSFLDPQAERRYHALARALDGLGLAAASHAVDSGEVVDESSGEPVRWQGSPMILAVSEGLRERQREMAEESPTSSGGGELRYLRRVTSPTGARGKRG